MTRSFGIKSQSFFAVLIFLSSCAVLTSILYISHSNGIFEAFHINFPLQQQVRESPCLSSEESAAYLDEYKSMFGYENSKDKDEDEDENNNRMTELVQKLIDGRVCSSLNHQTKFFTMKDKVIEWVKRQSKEDELLYGPPSGNYFAILINGTNSAYRHVFKCGGTTIMRLTENRYTRNEAVEEQGRKLFTSVRDPIDHFLSGWAECGVRWSRSNHPEQIPSFARKIDLNERIQSWLKCVKGDTKKDEDIKVPCSCADHSYPQSNFLFDLDVPLSIDSKLELVGDLSEVMELLGIIGFEEMDKDELAELPRGRDSSLNRNKIKYFPRDRALLSEETIRLICEFVILDYYLFDFTPPDVCSHQIESDMRKIQEVTL